MVTVTLHRWGVRRAGRVRSRWTKRLVAMTTSASCLAHWGPKSATSTNNCWRCDTSTLHMVSVCRRGASMAPGQAAHAWLLLSPVCYSFSTSETLQGPAFHDFMIPACQLCCSVLLMFCGGQRLPPTPCKLCSNHCTVAAFVTSAPHWPPTHKPLSTVHGTAGDQHDRTQEQAGSRHGGGECGRQRHGACAHRRAARTTHRGSNQERVMNHPSLSVSALCNFSRLAMRTTVAITVCKVHAGFIFGVTAAVRIRGLLRQAQQRCGWCRDVVSCGLHGGRRPHTPQATKHCMWLNHSSKVMQRLQSDCASLWGLCDCARCEAAAGITHEETYARDGWYAIER